MHPYMIVIMAAALMVLAAAVLMIRENQRQKEELRRRFRENFGTVLSQSYTDEEMERIGAFSRKKDSPKKGYLDDITWNDLEMDQIFARVNQTLSAPGEEVLYRMLRMPLSAETSGHFQEMTEFFRKDAKAREEMQLILAGIGKKTRYSLGSAAEELAQAPEISWIAHGVQAGALVLSLFLLPVVPVAGVFAVFGFLVFNAFTYQTGKDRRDTEAFRGLFAVLCQILEAGRKLEKITWKETEENCRKVAEIRRELGRFQKRSFWFTAGSAAGAGAAKLFLDYLNLFFHVDLLVYPGLLREAREHREGFGELLEAVGEIDAAIAVASFREQLPWCCTPRFLSTGESQMEVQDLFHPLLEHPVANSFTARRGVLLTGSNASGKSTFLKAAAVNAVLAQTISVCTASFYRAPRCQICTSIALRDSIQNGESYFMAEIRSLKRILALAEEQTPVLCVIDEVLRGTNTVERIAASSGILRSLARPKVYCFAATHDLELTQILRNFYDNYHFEETVTGGDVCFSYQLKNGPSVSRNALILLERSGYGEEIVTSAREAAENFEKNGVWEVLA